MALVPTRQFYLDSFQSSFSKFHDSTLLFFRCTSSIHPKAQTFCANLPNEKNPPRNPQADYKNVTLSTGNWLYQWNKPNKESRPKPPQAVLNYRGRGNSNSGSGSTMDRIVEKLKKHGYIEGAVQGKTQERVIEKGSVEDIFYVEEGMLPNARGGFSKESPLGVEDVFKVDGEVRFPWEKPKRVENQDDEEGKWTARSKSRTSLAELTLPESELKRLRYLTYQMKSKVRVKGAGVTEEVVNTIHERWKTSEIVRVKVEGAPALNMRRTHDILERKTGGLVIWRSGASVSLYRGVSYEVPSVQQNKRIFRRNELSGNSLPITTGKPISGHPTIVSYNEAESSQLNLGSNAEAEKKDTEGLVEVGYEDEVDKLLDGLGPRYTDWPGCNPLPVDADLLPGTVPGYQPPFRILPYGVRSTLGRKEATSLQRLARVLPPHFALGRSRQLQGLAVAMIKLWEKSSIAKVALKRGVQLTASERMAEDIKKLTGGMLLSRNKDFLVFYRGKDFLSPDVTEALLEREALANTLQDEEEQARLRASALIIPTAGETEQLGTAGTLEETWDAKARWGKRLDDSHKENMMRQAEMGRHASLVRKLERKLAFAERRIVKAERALSKVEEFLKPADRQADPESITDEERFMFRKLGLRMKAFLLLGRRGVFDGTVENMHLHWKYRELVKIILKAQNFEQVKKIALALEAESGGVLVSVDKISKGYAIIVYRGKDYERPSTLRPRNLLTKRKALARSIEIQRREALLKHISALEAKVAKITSEIGEMNIVKEQGDDELYDRLESAYPTDDDDNGTEEEGDDAYLETYNSENDAENNDNNDDETCNEIQRAHLDKTFLYNAQNQAAERDSEDGEGEEYLETDGSENEDEDLGRDTLHQSHPTNFPYNVENQVAIREPEVGMRKHTHE